MTERKFFLIGNDGKIRPKLDPHSNGVMARRFWHAPAYIMWNGKPMVRLGKGKGEKGLYSLRGRVYRYDYSLLRDWISLFHHHVTYEGHAMFFREDNPQAINFDAKEWQSDLEGAAHMLEELHDSDMPERLTRPRKPDWMLGLVMLMAGVMITFVGLMAAGRLK